MEFRVHYSKGPIRRSRERWWWTLVAGNGKTIATAGEKYVNKADCEAGIVLAKSATKATPIVWPPQALTADR